MACPEGQYFCNDRGKCMPIPKGHKVRKDGELVKEVAPPGWGHTKAEKEKTDPSKPKSKIGGSAAAFDRARKEGRFKGSKEDMLKLMWWMKNKGGKPKGKPHYKPGTDEKKKKYQDEDWKPEIEVIDTKKEAKKREKKRKEAESSLPPHLRLDTMKKAFAHTNEAIAPSPQEIQVHKKISMLQQKLAQLRKKTVNQAAKAGSAAKTADAEVTSENYEYVAEKRKTKINLKPTTKDQKGEGKFINRYNPRYLPYVEENDPLRPSHAAPNKLFQYKVKLPEVGETIVYANSPAELMIKLRLLVNPRLRGGIKIDRILPYDAYKFYTDKRAKALRRK